MIEYIKGRLTHKEASHIVIDIGGLGYHIRISLQTYSQIGNEENCKVYTYLQVREDAHTLYGFSTLEERQTFLHLISISGVGANTALVILSSMNPAELRDTILREDAKAIQMVKGIGGKTAQRIILELKDKIGKLELGSSTEQISASGYNNAKQEALSALVMLGLAKQSAEKSIDALLKKNPDLPLEEIIKNVLKSS